MCSSDLVDIAVEHWRRVPLSGIHGFPGEPSAHGGRQKQEHNDNAFHAEMNRTNACVNQLIGLDFWGGQ